MKILGIDPGLALLGWSVLETQNNAARRVHYGCVETPSTLLLNERLVQVYDDLTQIFDKHQPDVLALETLFFMKNAKTLAQVGHTRGVILLVAGQRRLPVFEYAPRQVKMALTGSGAADKRQMQQVVKQTLGLDAIPKPDDAADAVAIALCHAQYARPLGAAAMTV